jgi:gliding motility-associated-like protein
LLVINCSAQKEANIWYFGRNAGLDFSSGSPVAITNGMLDTYEGCATICDKNGALLFYTDGMTVYNKEHKIMLNGTGLFGNHSSTQSAVIIPHPGNSNLYYIFTVDAADNHLKNGLQYSMVDLSYVGGLGSVTSKNNILYTPSAEKITAVRHSNNRDIWVISHRFNSDEFYTYKIDSLGLNVNPIVSKVGTVHEAHPINPSPAGKFNSIGYLKVSPQGDKVAIVQYNTGIFEIFDFDNFTGKLNNARKRPQNFYGGSYGVEFSPDGSKVYVGEFVSRKIYQFDFYASDFFASEVIINMVSKRLGAIQTGIDGKLYLTKDNSTFLDVIEEPNKKGIACNYKQDAIPLKGKLAALGLPTFVQTYFSDTSKPKCLFTFKGFCVSDSFKFSPLINSGSESFFWNFGDDLSQHDTVTGDTVYYVYNKSGEYTVRLISSNEHEKCTAKLKIHVIEKPEILLPNDTFFCEGSSVLIKPIKYIGNISWDRSPKDTFPDIRVNSVGKLIATAKTECATAIAIDSINVNTRLLPRITLPNDTVFCEGNNDSIEPVEFTGKIFWNSTLTDTLPKLPVNRGGIYEATVINTCGNSRDIMRVEYILKPKVILPNDTFFCSVDSILLTPIKYEGELVWNTLNADTSPKINVKPPIKLIAEVTNICGVGYDSIDITLREPPKIELRVDSVICSGTPFKATAITDSSKIEWHDGDTSTIRNFSINKPTVLWAKTSNSCGTYYDSLKVTPKKDIGIYIPNSFSPNRDFINDSFSVFIDDFAPKTYQLKIYDRWGGEVFKSGDYIKSWDGKLKETECPNGVYIYMLNLLHCNRIRSFKGTITLIR